MFNQKDYQVYFRVEKEGKPTRVEDVIITLSESESEEMELKTSDKAQNGYILSEGIRQLMVMKNVDLNETITFLKMEPYDWRVEYLY